MHIIGDDPKNSETLHTYISILFNTVVDQTNPIREEKYVMLTVVNTNYEAGIIHYQCRNAETSTPSPTCHL